MGNYQNKSKAELIQIIDTYQKHSDALINMSEINLQGILSSMTDFVFVFDTLQRFTFVNVPSSQKLFTGSDKFLGKMHREVMPLEIHRKFEQAFKKNRQGKFSTYEYQLEIGNKQNFYSARMSPVFENKTFRGSLAIVSDITKHKKAEQKIEESELKFRSFFNYNDAIMLEINPETKIILNCNLKAFEFYGYSKEELLKKSIFEINIMSKDEIDSKMKTVINQKSFSSGFKHKLASNEIRDVEVYASPVKVQNKIHLFLLVFDITESLKNEKELENYRNHLEETVKERTKELEENNKKLEDYNELFIGREFRIKELRDEIRQMKEKHNG